jgi:hypothetical protein
MMFRPAPRFFTTETEIASKKKTYPIMTKMLTDATDKFETGDYESGFKVFFFFSGGEGDE